MIDTSAQALTAQFYNWERRGRGWLVSDTPVDLEPPFYPFSRYSKVLLPFTDDSKREGIFGAFANLFKSNEPEIREYRIPTEFPQIEAFAFDCTDTLVVYTVKLPKDENLDIEDMEQLLLMLSASMYPISFEVVGTGSRIVVQLACRQSDERNVCAQVKAYVPSAVLTKSPEGLNVLIPDKETCVLEFGLKEEFMRPLRTASDLAQDPFLGLFATLEHIMHGECGVLQVIFRGVLNPWAVSIMQSVTDSKGDAFFSDAPEMVKLAQGKVSSPLFGVCLRVAGQSSISKRAAEITVGMATAVLRLTSSEYNSLLPLQAEIPDIELIDDIYLRQTHRTGMLLNSREIATLVHFPTAEISSSKVERDTKKTKAAPESTLGHPFILGKNINHSIERTVSVPSHLRLRHTHVIGATGTGKSTLLLSMIAQDMQQGNGCAVLDPHGDLIEAILAYVPESRVKDVILIDPSDGEYPVGFNILSAHSEVEKDILSSDLVAAFRRLSTSWGDQMNSVFANAILAFLESSQGGTLLDLRRFLIEKSYRDTYLKTVQDAHIRYYWQHEYPLLKSSSIGSILTRLDTFLRPKLIRNMVAQKKGLDFENILDTKKILLVKLSQGLIGAENSFLLGTFFVSKMYQAAMARQSKAKENRSDYLLYIDEFQHYSTPSLSHILSGARKYHLGLILAHQDMQQLQKHDSELASSVVVNAGTRICFRLGDTDAKRFASGLAYFEATDLESLHTGEAIVRIEQPNMDFNLTVVPMLSIPTDTAKERMLAVIEESRKTYGTPKHMVEESLHETSHAASEPEKAPMHSPPVIVDTVIPKVIIPIPEESKKKTTSKIITQHRYLQTLIKKMAEARGFKAILEEQTPDGGGRVDVSLERNGKRIACEVSVTTDDTWEIHNIEKCFAAGYAEVIVCSNDPKNLRRIREQVQSKLSVEQQAMVFTLEQNEVIQHLDKQIVQKQPVEEVVKGYRVTVEYATSSQEEISQKQHGIVRTVVNSKSVKT